MPRQREFTFGTVPHQDLTRVGMHSHYGAAAEVARLGASSSGKRDRATNFGNSAQASGISRLHAERQMASHTTKPKKFVGKDETRRYAFQYGMSLN